MFSRRLASVVALSALLVTVGGGAFAAPLTPDSGTTAGGTTVSGTVTGVTFTQMSAGVRHSLAVSSDGNTYAWGYNNYGQLGINSTTNSLVPVRVEPPQNVTFTQVSAGESHSLAVGSDGNTYAWGYNNYGQLGNNAVTNSPVPVAVVAPSGVTFTQVSAAGGRSLAVGSDGNTYAWGDNRFGQSGNNSTTISSVPVAVLAPSGVTFTQVSAAKRHSLAVGSDGNTYAWGDNLDGQLGNNSTTDSPVPVVVVAPSGVTFTQVLAGASHSLAVGSDGKTYVWGDNIAGQLGNNSTTDSLVPVAVVGPSGVTFTKVSAGANDSLAVGSDGKTYAWGWNVSGQLGNNSTINSSVPVVAVAPTGVTFTKVSAGSLHSLAVGSDGNTYAWGDNSVGQLGNNSTINSLVPVVVEGFPVITGVSFDGVAGTGLTQSAGSWRVATPTHASGVVDVVVSYTQFGVANTETIVHGFTFGTTPAVTLDLSLNIGDDVTGASVTVSGEGLLAKSSYSLILRSTPTTIASGTTTSTGTFTDTAVIPAGLSSGQHTVTLSAIAADGSAISQVAYLTVNNAGTVTYLSYSAAEATTPAALAATGADVGPSGIIAMLLLLVGGALLATRRKWHTASA